MIGYSGKGTSHWHRRWTNYVTHHTNIHKLIDFQFQTSMYWSCQIWELWRILDKWMSACQYLHHSHVHEMQSLQFTHVFLKKVIGVSNTVPWSCHDQHQKRVQRLQNDHCKSSQDPPLWVCSEGWRVNSKFKNRKHVCDTIFRLWGTLLGWRSG